MLRITYSGATLWSILTNLYESDNSEVSFSLAKISFIFGMAFTFPNLTDSVKLVLAFTVKWLWLMCSFMYSVLKNSLWLLLLFSRTLLLSTICYLCLYLWKRIIVATISNILLQMCWSIYLPLGIIQYQFFRFMKSEREFFPPFIFL